MKRIEVFGPGCAKCVRLYENARAAVDALGLECELEKVMDIERMIAAGIMMTPALVVDGAVVSSGRVLSVSELERLFGGTRSGSGTETP